MDVVWNNIRKSIHVQAKWEFCYGDHLGILTIEKVVYYKTIADSWR